MRELTSNQRVGLLSGLALFLGSMLTAYYGDTAFWAWVTLTLMVFVVWILARTWREGLLGNAIKGLVFGAGVTLVARLLGLVAVRLITEDWRPTTGVEYDLIDGQLSDAFRILLNGDFSQSVGIVLAGGLVGLLASAGSYIFHDFTDTEEVQS